MDHDDPTLSIELRTMLSRDNFVDMSKRPHTSSPWTRNVRTRHDSKDCGKDNRMSHIDPCYKIDDQTDRDANTTSPGIPLVETTTFMDSKCIALSLIHDKANDPYPFVASLSLQHENVTTVLEYDKHEKSCSSSFSVLPTEIIQLIASWLPFEYGLVVDDHVYEELLLRLTFADFYMYRRDDKQRQPFLFRYPYMQQIAMACFPCLLFLTRLLLPSDFGRISVNTLTIDFAEWSRDTKTLIDYNIKTTSDDLVDNATRLLAQLSQITVLEMIFFPYCNEIHAAYRLVMSSEFVQSCVTNIEIYETSIYNYPPRPFFHPTWIRSPGDSIPPIEHCHSVMTLVITVLLHKRDVVNMTFSNVGTSTEDWQRLYPIIIIVDSLFSALVSAAMDQTTDTSPSSNLPSLVEPWYQLEKVHWRDCDIPYSLRSFFLKLPLKIYREDCINPSKLDSSKGDRFLHDLEHTLVNHVDLRFIGVKHLSAMLKCHAVKKLYVAHDWKVNQHGDCCYEAENDRQHVTWYYFENGHNVTEQGVRQDQALRIIERKKKQIMNDIENKTNQAHRNLISICFVGYDTFDFHDGEWCYYVRLTFALALA